MSDQSQTPPEVLDALDSVFGQLLDAAQSNIGRIVALFIPVFTAVVTAGAFWLQNVVGIDVQHYTGGAVAFITLVATSALGSGITWLRNRGKHEVAAVELAAAAKAGESVLAASAARAQSGGGVVVSPDRDFGPGA